MEGQNVLLLAPTSEAFFGDLLVKKTLKIGVSHVSGVTCIETGEWTGWSNIFLSRV